MASEREESLARLGRVEQACDALQSRSTTPSAGPAPGTPAYNQAWYAATAIFWDPAGTAGGSDKNSGTVIGSPVLTFAEIVRRYGSSSPILNYGQNVTITLLSSQPANTDPVSFTPKVSGGTRVTLLGTLAVVVAAFAGGAVTAKVQATGTRLQIATMPAAAAVNQLVFNSTRGSYAFIDKMVGATATVTQPLAQAFVTVPGTFPTEDNTWTTGDTLVISQCPAVNLKRWAPSGGDVTAGGAQSGGLVQFCNIVDPSGTGATQYPHICDAGVNILAACQIGTGLTVTQLASSNGALCGAGVFGCEVAGQFEWYGNDGRGIFLGGFAGGAFGGSGRIVGNGLFVTADAYLHGSITIRAGWTDFSNVFADGSISINAGGVLINSNAGILWGAASLVVGPACTYFNFTGTTFAATLLLTGTLQLGLLTTGTTNASVGTFTLNGVTPVNVAGTFPSNVTISWALKTVGSTPGTASPFFSAATIANQFTVQSPTANCNDIYNWQAQPTALVAITAANLDAFGGLTNPAIGARFCND